MSENNNKNERKWFSTKNPFRLELCSKTTAPTTQSTINSKEPAPPAPTSTKLRSKYGYSTSLPVSSQSTADFDGIEKTKAYSSIPETSMPNVSMAPHQCNLLLLSSTSSHTVYVYNKSVAEGRKKKKKKEEEG